MKLIVWGKHELFHICVQLLNGQNRIKLILLILLWAHYFAGYIPRILLIANSSLLRKDTSSYCVRGRTIAVLWRVRTLTASVLSPRPYYDYVRTMASSILWPGKFVLQKFDVNWSWSNFQESFRGLALNVWIRCLSTISNYPVSAFWDFKNRKFKNHFFYWYKSIEKIW